jgi:glycogen operon protein
MGNYIVERGSPYPFGPTVKRSGVNFAVFSKNATSVKLLLYESGKKPPIEEFILNPCYNKTGDVWHIFIKGLNPGIRYGYIMDMQHNPDKHIHRFDASKVLVDPYALAMSGSPKWGELYTRDGEISTPHTKNVRRSIVMESDFDWGYNQPLNIPLSETIIYEAHVRGFTQHFSSNAKFPGTFKGLTEKIPYLKDLGITAIELMPVNEFDEMETDRLNPITGERLFNYWGYSTLSFFTPKASYSSKGRNGEQVREFKEMVKSFHDAGIEVILDVVFNHTSEGNEAGPTISFKGLDNSIYYIIDPITGAYHNYSGCGNTINCNHPVLRNMIVDCLRYWVTEMHVDGFRFDLASILGRGQHGEVLANPPLLERIAADPVLADTKLIAEAWDAAGLYQVGTFPNWGRWAEWNGKFRDDIRRFVRGEPKMVSALATRLTGSADLYKGSGRSPYHSINFITSHDGFTLNDLVSYNQKHNTGNAENNRDGTNDNCSWNSGEEGASAKEEVNVLRRRQMKNFAALLMLSHGVPMITSGDEFGKTQKGNNNAYCQDNDISWLDWGLLEANCGLHRFFRELINFRKKHEIFRPTSFENHDGEGVIDITWHGLKLNKPDWSSESRSVAMRLHSKECDDDIFLIANSYWKPLKYELPVLEKGARWYRFLDTMFETPYDIIETGKEFYINDQLHYRVGARSVVVLVAKRKVET